MPARQTLAPAAMHISSANSTDKNCPTAPLLSLVIPVYNETESLADLYRQVSTVAAERGYTMQIIFVDDGSSDASWQQIRRLAADDARVEGIRFRRNFGKAAALNAGFQAACGTLVMTLDADLQDDPAEIPNFIEVIEQGYDVVSGWKKIRHDPWHKVLPSRVFNTMVSRLTGVKLHDHNCGIKCYRREAIQEVRLYGELHRFVPVLAHARGFRIGELVIQHRPRQHGRSKYGVERLAKGFLDLLTVKFLTGFGNRPQHLLGGIGLGAFFLGAFGMIYLATLWVLSRTVPGMTPVHLHQSAALYYCLGFLLMGGQFMSIGFLGELIISFQAGDREAYAVIERVGSDDEQPASMEN